MIGCCGIDCSGCEAQLATAADDDAQRAEVAEKWSKQYNADIKAEMVNCTGCNSEGVKFFYTENICEIRKCCKGRSLETCAPCEDYGCEKLAGIHGQVPDAKAALDKLRG
jgi:hypothetical protein